MARRRRILSAIGLLVLRLPTLRLGRLGIALGILAPIGMLLVSGIMLLDLRRDAWSKAEQNSKNLLQVLERDIARNIEIIDLSLQGVIDNLREPGVAQATPEMRQLILFDRAISARDMGVMLVLDEHGESIVDSGAVPARKLNNSARAYFQAHRARADLGLVISGPIVSQLLGTQVLVLSRRIDKPDGSFGGVVLGSLKLTYFSGLFEDIGLGRLGTIALYLRDGTRIMRYPFDGDTIGKSFAEVPNFVRFVREGRGSFVSRTFSDGFERHYSFTGIGDHPMLLNVALSRDEVEAEWREHALVLGLIVLVLCGLTASLSLLFGRELRRRSEAQAELARLSQTDALTGLSNRRRFETMFDRAWRSAGRTGEPLSLLVVDADHFKRYNDRYGHAVGDEVLIGLARCLAASVHRPEDLVFRVGGEEFVLLLPETDSVGALRIADRVHAEMATLTVEAASLGAGSVTVSIGTATVVPTSGVGSATADLYKRADIALYEAKAAGRNQTRCAAPDTTSRTRRSSPLRVVGAP